MPIDPRLKLEKAFKKVRVRPGRQWRMASMVNALAGLVWGDRGNRLTPSHCTKDGKRYRYCFSQATIRPDAQVGSVRRVPALELEGLTTRRLATFLGSAKYVLDSAAAPEDTISTRKALIARARTHASTLTKASDPDKRALLLAMLSQLIVAEDHIEIMISKRKLRDALLADPMAQPRVSSSKPAATGPEAEDLVRLRVETRLLRCGLDVRLIVPSDASDERPSRVDQALLKAVARGHAWRERLLSGKTESLAAIAEELGVRPRYVSRIFRCAFLAPDIVDAILDGKQPPPLTVERLRLGVPLAWSEQRRVFGFKSI